MLVIWILAAKRKKILPCIYVICSKNIIYVITRTPKYSTVNSDYKILIISFYHGYIFLIGNSRYIIYIAFIEFAYSFSPLLFSLNKRKKNMSKRRYQFVHLTV